MKQAPDSKQQISTSFSNLYPVTKTVRFNLLPAEDRPRKKITDEQFKTKIREFISNYSQIISNFEKVAFVTDNCDGKILNLKTKIRLDWVKTHCKQEFYENPQLIKYRNGKKTSAKITFRETPFLLDIFQNWIERNYSENIGENGLSVKSGILFELEKINNLPLEAQSRKADFNYWMHKILVRNNFDSIYSLFDNCIEDNSDNKLIIDTFEILKKYKKQLEEIENYLRPSQSFGLEIEKTSLNYFTVNKKPRDYKNELKIEGRKLSCAVFDLKDKNKNQKFQEKQFLKDVNFSGVTNSYLSKLEDKNFVIQDFNGVQKLNKTFNRLSLASLYSSLKAYKAEQKSAFYEYILGILEGYKEDQEYIFVQSHFNGVHRLFNFQDTEQEDKITKIKKTTKTKESKFTDFVVESKKIRDLSNEISKNKTRVKKLKEERGKHFDVQNNTCSFPKYKQICELFKSVAMDYGKIKAAIKGIEKEGIESLKLQSWSVLLEKDGQHSLVSIPKGETLSLAYKEVSNLQSDPEGDQSIWLIESLTLRALDKLCFGEKSTFRTDTLEVDSSFKRSSGDFFTIEKGKNRLKRIDEFPKVAIGDKQIVNQQILVLFYQKVLQLNSVQEILNIKEFFEGEYTYNPVFEKNINLEKFQSELEKACYIKKEIKISQPKLSGIMKNYNAKIYQITSYDLVEDRKKPKAHTNIWEEFCSLTNESGFVTRLNPEMKISYVEKRADSILDKTGKEVARNRRKQAEYILSTTITEYNDKPKFDMSFKDKDIIIDKIMEFNETLNDKIDPNDAWYYGLDRGQEELLTLGLFKFPNKRNEYQQKDEEWNKTLVGGEFEVWELPENKLLETKINPDSESGSIIIAYKNISYFTDLLILKKVNYVDLTCIDLTCAKLISDKIVINGDIATYLNLKLIAAYRKITDGIQNGIFTNESIFSYKKVVKDVEVGNEILALKFTNRGEEINYDLYFFDSRYKSVADLDTIKSHLQEHFDKIRLGNSESDNYPIEKINHLRDAICANAVGIINQLQKNKFGYICFENLDIQNKNTRFREFYGNLGSRIEIMLLNKFKNLGLVPPNYKNSISLQSTGKIKQLGLISYVETKGTSSNCPNCSQVIDETTKKLNKWGNHRFRCNNNGISCGFSTYSQEEINEKKVEEAAKNNQQTDPAKIKNNWDFEPNKKELGFLETSDDVACYNIAKRGLELITQSNSQIKSVKRS